MSHSECVARTRMCANTPGGMLPSRTTALYVRRTPCAHRLLAPPAGRPRGPDAACMLTRRSRACPRLSAARVTTRTEAPNLGQQTTDLRPRTSVRGALLAAPVLLRTVAVVLAIGIGIDSLLGGLVRGLLGRLLSTGLLCASSGFGRSLCRLLLLDDAG